MSLEQIIESKLRKILSLANYDSLVEIRLSRCKNYTTIAYRSAIAHELAKKTGKKAVEIASELVKIGEKSLNLEIKVSLVKSELIEFKLEKVDNYLEKLGKKLRENPEKIIINNDNKQEKFMLEFTLKRCYTLLNLGAEQGIIKIKKKEEKTINISWLEPEKVQYYRLFHEQEQQLISEIITFMDQFQKTENMLKSSLKLREKFWNFERYCRIFGEVKQSNLPLAQARLKLVYLTYLLLNKIRISP